MPDELNARLKERAGQRGQSLQQFLLSELRDMAERSPLEVRLREALGPVAPLSVSTADLVSALEAARLERDARLTEALASRGASGG